MDIISRSASFRVRTGSGSEAMAGQRRSLEALSSVGSDGADHPELHDLPGRGRISRLEQPFGRPTGRGREVRFATAEGLVGADVAEDVIAPGHVREVDDHVGAFGQAHQQPIAALGDVDGRRKEAALVADLPDLDPGDTGEVEDQEARLTAVEEAEAVSPPLHIEVRPGVAVDHDHVAEELRVPDGRDVGARDVRTGVPVEEEARVRIEQRAVRVEGAVLDGDGNLVVGLGRREGVVRLGSRTRKRRPGVVTQVPHCAVAVGTTADDVEAGRAGVDVHPRHAQRVVVVPDRRGAIVVRILEGCVAGAPEEDTVLEERLLAEEVEPRPFSRVPSGDVPRVGQVPGLRVTVALVADANGAVHMGDHRNGADVSAGRRLPGEVRTCVAPHGATRWVGPVQGLVDRQEVRQIVAARIPQVVDPHDACRAAGLGLDGERGRVVQEQALVARGPHRAVAPHRRLRVAGRQDLLRELLHRDLVVVDVPEAGTEERGRLRHDRRDEQRRHEFV